MPEAAADAAAFQPTNMILVGGQTDRTSTQGFRDGESPANPASFCEIIHRLRSRDTMIRNHERHITEMSTPQIL